MANVTRLGSKVCDAQYRLLIAKGNTAFALTINGGYVFNGALTARTTSKSWFTTEGIEPWPNCWKSFTPLRFCSKTSKSLMGITARKLAADIDVPPSRVSEVVNSIRPITTDTALRLGLYFQIEPHFWLNRETEFDMRIALRDLKTKIAPRTRVHEPTAA